jgi:predicted metalloendopeptidase
MVAAHELTHAFDSAGRLYNQDGKLEEWWTNKTSEAFVERQACIEKQYSRGCHFASSLNSKTETDHCRPTRLQNITLRMPAETRST